jgi:hypothetical protein
MSVGRGCGVAGGWVYTTSLGVRVCLGGRVCGCTDLFGCAGVGVQSCGCTYGCVGLRVWARLVLWSQSHGLCRMSFILEPSCISVLVYPCLSRNFCIPVSLANPRALFVARSSGHQAAGRRCRV